MKVTVQCVLGKHLGSLRKSSSAAGMRDQNEVVSLLCVQTQLKNPFIFNTDFSLKPHTPKQEISVPFLRCELHMIWRLNLYFACCFSDTMDVKFLWKLNVMGVDLRTPV